MSDQTYLVTGFTQDGNERHKMYVLAQTPYEAQVRAVTTVRFQNDSDLFCPVAVINKDGKPVDEENVVGVHYVHLGEILLNLRIVADMNYAYLSEEGAKVLEFIHGLDLRELDDNVIFEDLDDPVSPSLKVAGMDVHVALRKLAEELREVCEAVALDSMIGYLNAVDNLLAKIEWPLKVSAA